jgi:hypothetical protein
MPSKGTDQLEHQHQLRRPAVHHHPVAMTIAHRLTTAELTETSGLPTMPNGRRTKKKGGHGKDSNWNTLPQPRQHPAPVLRQHQLLVHRPL